MGKKEDDKRYYEKNKEKIKRYLKGYYEKNKEKIKENSKKNWHKNRDANLVKAKRYYQSNRQRMNNQSKEYQKNNKDKIKEYIREYNVNRRREDKNFNLRHRLRTRLNIVFKKYGEGKPFNATSYGVNYKRIIEHLKPFPKDIENYHIDHIKPLSSFDFTEGEQIKQAFSPENHQWLTIQQNLIKSNKW